MTPEEFLPEYLAIELDFQFAEAHYLLGFLYHYGYVVPKDPRKAFSELLVAAEGGLPCAQFTVGKMYCDGMGVERDNERGVQWVRRAVENGHVHAALELAIMYQNGEAHGASAEEILRLYLFAAEHGSALAAVRVGESFELGKGVARNLSKALEWYQKATKFDDFGDAYFKLSEIYREGRLGLDIDAARAEELHRQGSRIQEEFRRRRHAVWHQAARNRDPLAQGLLAEGYREGWFEGKVDLKKAKFWQESAAGHQGEPE